MRIKMMNMFHFVVKPPEKPEEPKKECELSINIDKHGDAIFCAKVSGKTIKLAKLYAQSNHLIPYSEKTPFFTPTGRDSIWLSQEV